MNFLHRLIFFVICFLITGITLADRPSQHRDANLDQLVAETLYDAQSIDRFALPIINGKPVDLRPAKTYQSLYLNADFGNDKISISVGPMKRVLDFSKQAQ